ncbi:hypothetical protein AB0B21_33480 [Streptomyces rimosus]|uniref:hypothetical protein n=1 Tax=Streptomyces rimosus TaxID=1927 RepID=UPI000518E1EF|nr:hypothetical protein [Streptomyces rimosus]
MLVAARALDIRGFRRSSDGIGADCGPGALDGADFLIGGPAWGAEENLAAIMTRRSLTVMSVKDGSALVVYQGERRGRSVTSSG